MNSFHIGILNGGKSARMGFPKSLIPVNRKTAIEVIYEKSALFTQNVFILGLSDQPSALSHVPTIGDKRYNGTLAALYSAFEASPSDWLLWAVDMPLIPADMVQRLLDYRNNYPNGVIAANPLTGRFETCFAYYPESLIRGILQAAQNRTGHFSIQHYLQENRFTPVFELYNQYAPYFKDWNTPLDIQLAI